MAVAWIDVVIFTRIPLSVAQLRGLVRVLGLVAQLIAAVIVVGPDPRFYIPLGVCAFALGIMEGGFAVFRRG